MNLVATRCVALRAMATACSRISRLACLLGNKVKFSCTGILDFPLGSSMKRGIVSFCYKSLLIGSSNF